MQRLLAEAIGTAILLATIIGSGIMGDSLSGGNGAIALLANSIATGAMLVVLISILGPISGAHFNPVVTTIFWLKGQLSGREALLFTLIQIAAGIIGVWIAHAMFDQDIIQISTKLRSGPAHWFSEVIATFGLILVILGAIRHRPDSVATLVGLYITAAYWFTASTSFANPAVTIARGFTNGFAGIAPSGIAMFIFAQCLGAIAALAVANILFGKPTK